MDFEQLRALYKTWTDTRWERYQAAVMFTRRFNDGFVSHLQAPSSYTDMDGQEGHYIELVRMHPLNDELMYYIDDSSDSWSRFDGHITEEKEDGLVFGIKVALDRSTNSWPKETVSIYRFSFRPHLDEISLFLFKKSFQISLKDQESWKPVYEQMTEMLVNTLNTVESQDAEKSTPSTIGFIAHAPS